MIIIHTLYEYKDYHYAYSNKKKISYWMNNSFINSIGDTIACIFGLLLLYMCNIKNDLKIHYIYFILFIIIFKLLYKLD